MQVSGLFRYPLKGAQGHALDSAEIQDRGIALDRRWMLVDASGRFCSQRELPELGCIEVQAQQGQLRFDRELVVEQEACLDQTIEVQVWKDQLKGHRVSQAADAWFSQRLGQALTLVRLGPQSLRKTPEGDSVSFADGYPILVSNSASLADLQRKIGDNSIVMAAFRPNLVIESDTPWAEDRWHRLQIGGLTLELINPCVRCKVTTLDPLDPQKVHPRKEPLKTLASFRRSDKGVTFGWNAVLRGEPGQIQTGMPVHATPRDEML